MNFEVSDDKNSLSGEDLSLINRFTRKELSADEVYTFTVILCDNEIDRDTERFDRRSLEKLCELFDGKTGIFDHSMRSSDQTARIYKTELCEDSSKKTSLGDTYTYVKGYAYMPKTAKNADLITEIDSGIKKEVSIGCSVKSTVCSECGDNIRSCAHVKGQTYSRGVCHGILTDPTDAYEWSFVAVPAQRAAGVTKAFSEKEENSDMETITKKLKDGGDVLLSEKEAVKLRLALDSLQKDAALGKEYKELLLKETLKLAMTAMPNVSGDSLKSVCEKLSADELTALKSGFSKIAEKQLPLNIQLSCDENISSANNEFKI